MKGALFEHEMDSIVILSAEYDHDTRDLYLEFRNGKPKVVRGVPLPVWGGLLEEQQGKELQRAGIPGYESASIGRFYNRNIRLVFKHDTYEGPDSDPQPPASAAAIYEYFIVQIDATGNERKLKGGLQYHRFAIMEAESAAIMAIASGDTEGAIQVRWSGQTGPVHTIQLARLAAESRVPLPSAALKSRFELAGA